MAVASLDEFQAGISISDAPVGYTPPVGPDMRFQITYHQRLAGQPSAFNFSNLGKKWIFNWLSYIGGGPTNSLLQATCFAPGGSQYIYGGYKEITPSSGWFHLCAPGRFSGQSSLDPGHASLSAKPGTL
jgi:hypothetical protein